MEYNMNIYFIIKYYPIYFRFKLIYKYLFNILYYTCSIIK